MILSGMEPSRKRRASVAVIAIAALLALAAAAVADVDTGANARVSFQGWIVPKKLPRSTPVPVSLHVGGRVRPLDGRRPSALRRVRVEINRHGVFSTRGLPTCRRRTLIGSTTALALKNCGDALVGRGRFAAHVEIPEGAPFPSSGTVLAFNSTVDGHPGLVAQVYGTDPVPTAQVVPISLERRGSGGFGTTLTLRMPEVGHEWGYVTYFAMTFHRVYSYRGRTRSFLSASCPAPAGISTAPFRAARGTYFLGDGRRLSRVIGGSCRVG